MSADAQGLPECRHWRRNAHLYRMASISKQKEKAKAADTLDYNEDRVAGLVVTSLPKRIHLPAVISEKTQGSRWAPTEFWAQQSNEPKSSSRSGLYNKVLRPPLVLLKPEITEDENMKHA